MKKLLIILSLFLISCQRETSELYMWDEVIFFKEKSCQFGSFRTIKYLIDQEMFINLKQIPFEEIENNINNYCKNI